MVRQSSHTHSSQAFTSYSIWSEIYRQLYPWENVEAPYLIFQVCQACSQQNECTLWTWTNTKLWTYLKHEIFAVGNFPLKFNCLVLERDKPKGWTKVWRNDSVFRSAFCSCRGPGSSSSTHDGPLTSSSGNDAPCWPLRELHSCARPLQLKKRNFTNTFGPFQRSNCNHKNE